MEGRVEQFQRNVKLECLLKEINEDLKVSELAVLQQEHKKKYPIILVMGALRSGTTLMMQWLANTGEFGYPSNLLSRFYDAPIIGAKIQNLLLNPEYDFRNEIFDFSKKVEYNSQNGKTQGALAPNEFWYFWRRFFLYQELQQDYISNQELNESFDKQVFVKELMGICDVFKKPFAMKGMIANYNIEFLDQILQNVVFIYVKREPCANIESVLEARIRQFGDVNQWYSFRIPEMEQLIKIREPEIQVAGQLYYINKAIENGLSKVSENRKMVVQYEDFCDHPEIYYHQLREKLCHQGFHISQRYIGEARFSNTRTNVETRIKEGYSKFIDMI